MKNELVTFLPWDTDHFGHRIGRATIRRLDSGLYRQLEVSCEDLGIDCLYFLVDAADEATILELQCRGFIFVDIRTTLERKVPDARQLQCAEDVIVRPSNFDDLESLATIALESFTSTRFFADPIFDDEKASRLYRIWLTKSVTTDFADKVLVAEIDRESVGFVTCHVNRHSSEGNIGLVALEKSAQGRGLSQVLIQRSLEWFRSQEMKRVNVVTQGRNIAAQRLYQRCGFVTRSTELWFHKWFLNNS